MNTYKRYLAIVATAIICTASLPLGAMKEPDQQKNNRVTPKMVFLQAVAKQDLDYIKNNITSMDPTTLQTALNALQDFQESEMYTFIANHVSPQPPQNDKKRKREDESDTTPQENEQEEIKKRKIQEKIFLNAAKEEKIGIIMQNYTDMSDETISKTIDLVQESIKIKKEKKEIKSDYESKVAHFLYRELNTRDEIKKLENNTPQTDDSKKNALECGVCTEKFEQNECIIELDCNLNASHYFHPDCIKKWAKEAINISKSSFKCPLCIKEHPFDTVLTPKKIRIYNNIKNVNIDENNAKECLNMFIESVQRQNGFINNDDINEFCSHIIQKNYCEIVNDLVFSCLLERLNKNNLEEILELAAKNGNEAIVQEFFKPQYLAILNSIEKDEFEVFFKFATQSNIIKKIKKLFESEENEVLKKIHIYYLSWVFIIAAENGDLIKIQEFFNPNNKTILEKISKHGLEKALELAAENGRLNIIEFFFKPNNKTILEKISKHDLGKVLGKALGLAAKNGRLNIIEFFFKPNNKDILEKISNDDLGKALIDAAQKGHLTIIQEFFNPNNKDILEKISNNHLGFALIMAALKGRLTIIQEFSNNKIVMRKIDQEDLQEGLKFAKTDEIKNEIKKHISYWSNCNIQ